MSQSSQNHNNPVPKVGQILYFRNYFTKDNQYRLVVEEIRSGYYKLQCIKTGNYSRYKVGTNYINGLDDHRDWEIVSDPNDNHISS